MNKTSKQGGSTDGGVAAAVPRNVSRMFRLVLEPLAKELQSCRMCGGRVFLLDEVCKHCGVANPVIVGCSKWLVATAALCEVVLIWLCLS